MKAIETITGPVSVLNRDDVDTDQIIPKQFLKRVERTGFGEFLFYDWAKEPDWDLPRNEILVTGRNFGCGSSREHAPWALLDFGIRCVISEGFADIFYNNCFKNGILPIKVPKDVIDKLMDDASRGSNAVIEIDLEKQEIKGPDGGTVHFEIDPFRKRCLLEGLDDIGLTMEKKSDIDDFEKKQRESQPWLHAAE